MCSGLPDLFLIRHGQTVWNREERLQGRHDSNLTAAGRAQAEQLAEVVAAIEAERISSPQGRAVETARIVFGGAPFRQDPRLVEIDVGAFTGRCLPELRAEQPEIFAAPGLGWYDLCLSGEGFAALERRSRAFLADLTGPALIVGHGVSLRMIWAIATGAGIARLHEAPLEQGGILAVLDGKSRVLHPTNGLASPAV